MKILEENLILNSYFQVKEALVQQKIQGKTKQFKRLKLERNDAVAILLYNKQKDTVVLVKQYRYPVYDKIQTELLEAPAGLVDENETYSQAIIREVQEETGYVIQTKHLYALSHNFVSPGYSSEQIYNYAAVVTNNDKKYKGEGKETENENIEIVEMPYIQFRSLVESGGIIDAKTKLLYYEASNKGIFKQTYKKKFTKTFNKEKENLNDQLNLFPNAWFLFLYFLYFVKKSMEKNKKNNFSRADNTLLGNVEVNYEISNSGNSYNLPSPDKKVINFLFNQENNTIEVTYRQPSMFVPVENLLNEAPDKVWKEIYGVKDNKIQLIKTIEGRHMPGHYVEERIEFDEESKE